MVLNSISANLVTKPSLFILSTNLSSFLSSIPSATSSTHYTDGLAVYKQAIEELFGSGVHQRVKLGHNNAVESRHSLLKDFIRVKRGFKKFNNILKYINGWVYIHNLFKDLGGDKYAIIQSLFSSIIQS